MRLKENDNEKLSIIVPVYNMERYLTTCLESLTNQTYPNTEIILVDDGSTDGSGHICDTFSKDKKQFKVIHKRNGGVSSARNVGLEAATGDYIAFLDPDDWVDDRMYEKLLNLIHHYQADVSVCEFLIEDGSPKETLVEEKIKTIEMTHVEAINEMIVPLTGTVTNKLFKREILKSPTNILFNEKITSGEDFLFCCEYLMRCQKLIYHKSPMYHVRIHENNTTKPGFNVKKTTLTDAFEGVINLISNDKRILVSKYKSRFIRLNQELLIEGLNEKKMPKDTFLKLKRNLSKYKIADMQGASLKLSCLLMRFSVHLVFFTWKLTKALKKIIKG